jgi:hypothetical protein
MGQMSLNPNLQGDERHDFYGDHYPQMGVSHPMDMSHLPLSHDSVPPHLMVAPLNMGSMPMHHYGLHTAPPGNQSPKQRPGNKIKHLQKTVVPETNFIFLVPAASGRSTQIGHAVAFGKCHFEGKCSSGCQKFKPQMGNYDICSLCGHDEGYHEQMFREDDSTNISMIVNEHKSSNGGFAVAPRGPNQPSYPGQPSGMSASSANTMMGVSKSKKSGAPSKSSDKRKDKHDRDHDKHHGGEDDGEQRARRVTERYLGLLQLKDLSEKCRSMGISPHGTKDKLINRLIQAGYVHKKKEDHHRPQQPPFPMIYGGAPSDQPFMMGSGPMPGMPLPHPHNGMPPLDSSMPPMGLVVEPMGMVQQGMPPLQPGPLGSFDMGPVSGSGTGDLNRVNLGWQSGQGVGVGVNVGQPLAPMTGDLPSMGPNMGTMQPLPSSQAMENTWQPPQ